MTKPSAASTGSEGAKFLDYVESEDGKATGALAALTATRSRPSSSCKRIFANTQHDSDDSDSHDDPGL